MMELTKFIIIILLALISISGFIFTAINMTIAKRKDKEQHKQDLEEAIGNVRLQADLSLNLHIEKQESCVTGIKESLARLEAKMFGQETKMSLFWGAIESNFGKLLKSFPTAIDKDILITKMIERRLNLEEANMLKEIFINELEIKQVQDKNEVITYTWLIAALDQRIYDLEM